MNRQKMIASYYDFDQVLFTALWSSSDDNSEPLDENYFIADIDSDSYLKIRDLYLDFVFDSFDLIQESGLTWEQVAHDYWLTSQGHGTGFWDRGLGEIGEKLTQKAQEHKSNEIYVGDDDKIYC